MTTTAPRIAEALDELRVSIGELNLDPANARSHDRKNLEAIKASLRRFGQRVPVVVQREGMIVRAGNGRVAAAIEMGWDEIAAVVVDESNVEATAYAIADNRTAELAEWDDDVLRATLRALDDDGALDELGFDDMELQQLIGDLVPVDDLVDAFGKAAHEETTDPRVQGKTSVTLIVTNEDAEPIRRAIKLGQDEFSVKVGELARELVAEDEADTVDVEQLFG